jgi:hypothetical protein
MHVWVAWVLGPWRAHFMFISRRQKHGAQHSTELRKPRSIRTLASPLCGAARNPVLDTGQQKKFLEFTLGKSLRDARRRLCDAVGSKTSENEMVATLIVNRSTHPHGLPQHQISNNNRRTDPIQYNHGLPRSTHCHGAGAAATSPSCSD